MIQRMDGRPVLALVGMFGHCVAEWKRESPITSQKVGFFFPTDMLLFSLVSNRSCTTTCRTSSTRK